MALNFARMAPVHSWNQVSLLPLDFVREHGKNENIMIKFTYLMLKKKKKSVVIE